MNKSLSQVFKKNRAEEFPDDLWNKFVLPIDYEKNNLLKNSKGSKIEGGRGTGKTMYLKYHCYPTQLSKNKDIITNIDIENIGIYWRPDTHFVQLINSNYLGDKWHGVFNTYVGLSLLTKFSDFIKKLIDSNYDNSMLKESLSQLMIPTFISEELKHKQSLLYIDLKSHCEGMLYKLQNWLNAPYIEPPIIIDGKASLVYIISDLKKHSILSDTSFHIFIDEFENLRKEQQIIINDWMKHGEKPLIYSVAYKKYAKVSNRTTGSENTQRRNDHRIIDIIDDVYAKSSQSFKIFAAEIIASKLQEYNKKYNIVDKTIISDIHKQSIRKVKSYQEEMLSIANHVFPELSYSEIADTILYDKTLFNKISRNIKQALKEKKSILSDKNFIDKNFPDATIVNSILLFRTRTNPDELDVTFKAYKKNEKSKIVNQYNEQIGNTIVGAILYLYSSFPKRICPIYSGYNKFCLMSKNNLRHLLELCYQSFVEFESNPINLVKSHQDIPTIQTEYQLKAAKFCSKQELDTLSELGPYGQELQKIANRLGRIFYLKQRIRTQSQPENIHFSVETSEFESIDEKIQVLIQETLLWNVLQESNITKGTEDNIATVEYMLTPMLAPFYKITPRKIHKIIFTINELKIILLENDQNFDNLYNKFIKDWKIDTKEELIQQSLFGDLY